MTARWSPPAALLDAAGTGMSLAYWAACQPDAPAIHTAAGARSFGDLNAKANQLVRALRRRGVAPGDPVALLSPNRSEVAEVVAAVARGGARFTPINWHLTGEEAGYILDDCDAVAVVADARLAELATTAGRDAPRATCRLALGGAIPGWEAYEDALAVEDPSDLVDPTLGTTMLYTSGTTGRPKGVHRPVDSAGAAALTAVTANLFGYRPGEDTHLCTGPLYHAAPLAFSLSVPLSLGVPVVLMDSWDAEEALRLISEHRVTHTHLVPTMFHRLLALPDDVRDRYSVASLRHVLHGAAPCPVPVKHAFIDWVGPIVVEYYAATEGIGTFVDSPTWLRKPGTVGAVRPPGQIIIGDDAGRPIPPNEIGLVYLKAPPAGRFDYYKDRDKTAASYRGEYFTLGDLGYLDPDGFLFLTDRSADLIISGGVNIYPAEVDGVLLTHPQVADAAAIGVPDAEWGEEVLAIVELRDGVERSPQLEHELIEFCRARLARFKCPRRVTFADTLPRQDNGKIAKHRLRERYRGQPAPAEARPADGPR